MTTLIFTVVAFVGGFVFGTLFTRRNTKKVEDAIARIEAAVNKK